MLNDLTDVQGYLAENEGEEISARYADLLIDDVFKLAFGQEEVMIEFLNRIITDKKIVGLDFNLDVNENNHNVLSTYRLCEINNHTQLTDKYTIIFIELRKFRKTLEELDTDILDGIYFCLKNIYTLKNRPKQFEHDIFKRIFAVTELANMDEVQRAEILSKMTTERDLKNQMAYAAMVGRKEGLEEGHKEGRAEGRVEGKAEAVRKMLEAGLEMEKVCEIMEITKEEAEACIQ